MRITVIGPAYPLRGGIAHHVYCLKQELTRRGHSVQVISFRKLYPHIFFPGQTELDVSSATLDAGAEPVLNPLNPITWARAFKSVKDFSPALVIFQWWQPFFGLMIGTLVRLFHKKGLRCIVEGLNVLLAAMPKVLSQIDCQLLIVGEFYDSIERYRELIHKLELEQDVHIDSRYVPNEEVVGIFDRADVLVLPYLSATQSAVAQIALRNGLPLIASRTGGLSEVVIENVNGLLFPPGNSNALADKIISYFSNNSGPAFAKNIISSSATPREDLGQVIEDLVRVDLNSASLWKSSGVRDLA